MSRRLIKAAIISYVVAEFFLTPDFGLVQTHAQSAGIPVAMPTTLSDQFGDQLSVNKDGSLNVNTSPTPSLPVSRASGCSSSSAQESLALPTPPAAMYTYITSLFFNTVVAAGGTAETGVAWTDTNMSVAGATTTITKASSLGTANTSYNVLSQSYLPAWREAAPGAVVTFKSPTTSGIAYCISATYYFGP